MLQAPRGVVLVFDGLGECPGKITTIVVDASTTAMALSSAWLDIALLLEGLRFPASEPAGPVRRVAAPLTIRAIRLPVPARPLGSTVDQGFPDGLLAGLVLPLAFGELIHRVIAKGV